MARILVIDDEPLLRKALCEILEYVGFRVLDAPNGKEGLDLHDREPVDLVITDIFMPEKEGIETIKEFRENYPDLKIVAMSGGGGMIESTDYLKLAVSLGADKVFRKPFKGDEIVEAVQSLLNL